MRMLLATAAAAVAIATAGLVAGIAVAQGNGNNGKDANQPSGQAVGWSNNHGPTADAATIAVTTTTSTDAGVKPSNTTEKWTSCTTGAGGTCPGKDKADVSKRYGNGKTAAQIVTGKGAPPGTTLKGPGNSQPHKVTACGLPDNHSGGVDVHAYKANSKKCTTSTTATEQTTTTAAPATTAAATTTTTEQTTTTTEQTTTTVAATAATNAPPAASSGVLGTSKALNAPPAATPNAPAGVLGTLKTLGAQGTLPFTGLQLWIVELIALGLIGAGVATRLVARRSTNY